MDILDILIAKNESFTGETEKLVRDANEAMQKANEVATKVDQANSLLEEAQSAVSTANEANTIAQETAASLETIKTDITNAAQEVVEQAIDDANNELNEKIDAIDEAAIVDVVVEEDNGANYKGKKAKFNRKKNNKSYNITKNYTTTGDSEDGGMTQKAITEELEKIKNQSSSSAASFDKEDEGQVVIVGEDGTIKPGEVSEDKIIEALINSGTYNAKNAVGLEIDYKNRNFTRIQEATNLNQGADFDKYEMYGGRRRCIVNRDGLIVAWYGDNDYVEDGSLGQVMYYQPKFYYNRAIISYKNKNIGKAIEKEILIISSTSQTGFKVHPLFKDENGEEIDYVLLPAYETTFYDMSEDVIVLDDSANIDPTEDYLLSIAGAKPISGVNKNFTVEIAEQMAQNIGNGWHITNMAAESANQMLQMVEFGQMNGQLALEAGIVNLSGNSSVNGASITGSTSALGNNSGVAEKTVNEVNGVYTEYDTPGYRAISYRGFENPWGNIYRFIGGVNLYSDGTMGAGIPYIANDYNYTPNVNGTNYINIGYQLPSRADWISAMGYSNSTYDWVYLPAEAEGASSLMPVGDFIWVNSSLDGIGAISVGGTQRQGDSCGMFYYACDQKPDKVSASLSARIMHIPTKDSTIYLNNIASWRQQIGA